MKNWIPRWGRRFRLPFQWPQSKDEQSPETCTRRRQRGSVHDWFGNATRIAHVQGAREIANAIAGGDCAFGCFDRERPAAADWAVSELLQHGEGDRTRRP